ncbi:MAG: DUF72 domain-containing protein [Acidobacteria bacterium]|nr:DUF72 domain-containing protein [Acidobacteriota bacterium]
MPRAPQDALPGSATAQAAAASRIFAGTSGWAYPAWKPAFYPGKLPAKRFLEYYSTQLSSVEVNYTFRALPTATMLENWLAATPDFFRFSFKAPQRITHIKRLANVESDVAYFVSTLEPVRQAGKLGLLLFQLPPNMKADLARLTTFLAAPALRAAGAPSIAFEFRHESWFADDIYDVLRAHNAALCIAESDGFATPEVHTAATHTSFRLRRTGAYTQAEIEAFAARFSALARQRDTYIYFKHEDEPTGALNAVSFLAALGRQAQS